MSPHVAWALRLAPIPLSVSPNRHSPISSQTLFVPQVQRPKFARWRTFPVIARKRSRYHPLTAVFNGNGNRSNDGFTRRSAEFLASTGRFLQSPSGQVVLWMGLVWLVLTGRIGFIFDSFLFLFAFVTIVPVLAVLTFRWWLSRQLVQGICPSCGSVVTGLKGQSFPCTVCGNTVQGENTGSFSVKDPTSATIDIDAKEIDD